MPTNYRIPIGTLIPWNRPWIYVPTGKSDKAVPEPGERNLDSRKFVNGSPSSCLRHGGSLALVIHLADSLQYDIGRVQLDVRSGLRKDLLRV
jgi:hypothetical protein